MSISIPYGRSLRSVTSSVIHLRAYTDCMSRGATLAEYGRQLQFTSELLLIDPVADDLGAAPKILQRVFLPPPAQGPHPAAGPRARRPLRVVTDIWG
jgi:hypothetical protein